MDRRMDSSFEHIDHNTCRSICDAVGERLQNLLTPQSELPARLAQLMDELRRRDGATAGGYRTRGHPQASAAI
jgi:hypothetical protein